MTFCLNSTNEDVQASLSTVFFYVYGATLAILIVCGNLLVIISISHFKQLHTPTNFLILSLATADIMVGIIDVPFQLASKMCLGIDTTLCYVAIMCSYHVTFLSIYNVALISLDRFYALSYPFHYSKKVTVKVISVVICTMWCISFMYNFALVYYSTLCTNDMYSTENSLEMIGIWANIDFFVAFVLPCSVITILYIKIFAIARKHAKQIHSTTGQAISGNTKYKKNCHNDSERKAAMKLSILVMVFIMCLFPYALFVQLSDIIPATIIVQCIDAALAITQLNSAVNPIIYALLYPWFRRSAKLIVTLKIFSCDSRVPLTQ